MFIKVTETRYDDEFLVNTDNISCIYTNSNTILVNGVTGNGNGLYNLTDASMKRLLNNITEVSLGAESKLHNKMLPEVIDAKSMSNKCQISDNNLKKKIKHEGMIRGFSQLSKAWYGAIALKNANYIDTITFGFYYPHGGTSGEISVNWMKLDGEIIPQLTIFSDAWSALSNFHDLIDLLGQHDNEDPSPEQFCQYLEECKFKDITEIKQK